MVPRTAARRRGPARTEARVAPLAVLLGVLALAEPASADAPVVARGVRVDGIAAVVGGSAPGPGVDVILRSDVELRARIALSGQSHRSVGFVALPDGLLAATLDELVGQVLIAREAERVRVATPTDADVSREVRRLEEEAGGASRLADLLSLLGASQAEVEKLARRRALVASFLQANLEGTTVITDAQVERVYEEGEHPFTDRPLEEVRDDLRAWLARIALDRAVGRWVSVLRARTPVQLLVHWGG